MSNAKDTAPAAPAVPLVPDKFLDAGEVVILAIKPSIWYVLLDSFPALIATGAVAAVGWAAAGFWGSPVRADIVASLCAALAAARLLVSCFRWAGRLYVLTNVRIMRVRGVIRADVFQCPLKQIRGLNLTASLPEKIFAAGSLWFEVEGAPALETAWLHIAQPNEVHSIVREAIGRAGR